MKRHLSDASDGTTDSSFDAEFPMASFEDDAFDHKSASAERQVCIPKWLFDHSQRFTSIGKPAPATRIFFIFGLAVAVCYFAGAFFQGSQPTGTYAEWKESIAHVAGHKAEVRGLRLSNGLNVVLWSDAQMDKAGAAVAFDAGSWSDPEQHLGVAHFLEHMVFMGSARFPQQDVLFAFLAQHGGSGNAYTASETTNYFFEVDSPFLQHATSIMADSVIDPLLSRDAAAAEINAVNAEHAKNRARDGWRIDMLGRSFALPHHELSRFSTGNEDTLRSSLPALREFHSKYYTAAHAAAAVAGPLSLDDLEAVAVTAFGHMRRHTVPASADDSGDEQSPTTSTGAPRRLQPYLLAGAQHASGLQARSTSPRPPLASETLQDGSLWRLPLWVFSHSLEHGCSRMLPAPNAFD